MGNLKVTLGFTFVLGLVILSGFTSISTDTINDVHVSGLSIYEGIDFPKEYTTNLDDYASLSVQQRLQNVVLAHVAITIILLTLTMLFVTTVNSVYIFFEGVGHIYVYTHQEEFICIKSTSIQSGLNESYSWIDAFYYFFEPIIFVIDRVESIIFAIVPLEFMVFWTNHHDLDRLAKDYEQSKPCRLTKVTDSCSCHISKKHKEFHKKMTLEVQSVCALSSENLPLTTKQKNKSLKVLRRVKAMKCSCSVYLKAHLIETVHQLGISIKRKKHFRHTNQILKSPVGQKLYPLDINIEGKTFILNSNSENITLGDIKNYIDNEIGYPSHIFHFIQDGVHVKENSSIKLPGSNDAFVSGKGGGYPQCDHCRKDIRKGPQRELDPEISTFITRIKGRKIHNVCNGCRHAICTRFKKQNITKNTY